MKKLVVSDVDGTLLIGNNQELSEDFFDMICYLKAKGITFAAASGRQLPSLKMIFEPVLDDILLIAENGALISSQDNIIYENILDKKVADMILQDIRSIPSYDPIVSTSEVVYVSERFDRAFRAANKNIKYNTAIIDNPLSVNEDILKVTAYSEVGFSRNEVITLAEKWQQYANCTMSNILYLDFMNKGVSKGDALGRIMKRLSVNPEECIVFGDNYNDISMFDMVQDSYVMNSAYGDVKQSARYETDSVYKSLYNIFKKD